MVRVSPGVMLWTNLAVFAVSLVVGAVNGEVKKFVNKMTTINSKNGPFTMLLVAGDFFGTSALSEDAKDLLANHITGVSLQGSALVKEGGVVGRFSLVTFHMYAQAIVFLIVPCPTYILQGRKAFPAEVQQALEATGEVCANLFALGTAKECRGR